MRKHKISRERAREEMGEESLNGRVKGARHGCSRRNCVTLMFAKEKKDSIHSHIGGCSHILTTQSR